MHLRSIEMRAFGSHEATQLAFPKTGIVFVTGDNGSGKSTIIDSVPAALWGETVREDSLWSDKSIVKLEADNVTATRTRTARKTTLEWQSPTTKPTKYETATKAQAALDGVIGAYDVWRQSHVFSSSGTATFTNATDTERKRLIERMMHLGKFDVAAERVKTKLSLARTEAERLASRVNALSSQRESLIARIADARTKLDSEHVRVDVSDLRADIGALEACVADARVKLRDATRVADKLSDEARAVEYEARSARVEYDRLARGQCAACARPFDSADVKRAEEALSKANERVAALKQTSEKLSTLRTAIATLQSEIEANSRTIAQHTQRVHAIEVDNAAYAQMERTIQGFEAEAEKTELAVMEATAALKTKQRDVDLYVAAATVLSLRGARASILARALSSLQQLANAWLRRLGSLQINLTALSEKADGGVSDKIGLTVLLSNGRTVSYKSASSGERRRVDVAVTLALAELAQGGVPGTLFFDEVFDSLDAKGLDAVTSALRSLSAQRCVVVISHDANLAGALGREVTSHWRVTATDGVSYVSET